MNQRWLAASVLQKHDAKTSHWDYPRLSYSWEYPTGPGDFFFFWELEPEIFGTPPWAPWPPSCPLQDVVNLGPEGRLIRSGELARGLLRFGGLYCSSGWNRSVIKLKNITRDGNSRQYPTIIIMIYYDLLWSIMIYYDLLWSIMIYYVLLLIEAHRLIFTTI